MKFLLNGTPIEENTLPSDMTALRYMREQRGLVGTKEGCASGDCGACTLLIGALSNGKVEYSTINSCITPIQALNGKHVVSVEYLSATATELHPAQQSMVEKHGSQCGFCTPGFVMSLAGLYEIHQSQEQAIDRKSVCNAISGNLCRCTGYKAIIEAGLAMDKLPAVKVMSNNESIHAVLTEFELATALPGSNYICPTTVTEATNALANTPDAKLIAGGTDIMLENTQRFRDFSTLIDLTNIAELKELHFTNGTLTIGAAVTYTELEHFLADKHPQFGLLLERIASRQIRNRGTIGGNVANASPIADLPPVLLCFEATVQISGPNASSRTVDIASFNTDYKKTLLQNGELITSFQIAEEKLQHFYRFYKVSKRIEDDISSVMLAARFEVSDGKIASARIAFGGMAAIPIRALNAESALTNQAVNAKEALDAAISALQGELTPMSDMRASAQYRLDIACNLLKKAWLELNGEKLLNIAEHAETEGQAHA